MADAPARRRGGRKPVAARRSQTVRIPVDHYAAYEEAAREEGLPMGDYLVRELARVHGYAVPDYIVKRQQEALGQRMHQQELPISA
jgi:hypothetical protein